MTRTSQHLPQADSDCLRSANKGISPTDAQLVTSRRCSLLEETFIKVGHATGECRHYVGQFLAARPDVFAVLVSEHEQTSHPTLTILTTDGCHGASILDDACQRIPQGIVAGSGTLLDNLGDNKHCYLVHTVFGDKCLTGDQMLHHVT